MSENYQDSDTFDEELIQRCCQSVIGLRDAGLYPRYADALGPREINAYSCPKYHS
jgi:hypothetical protein